MPTYSGRISASFFVSGDIEYGHLIRSAITGAGIVGHSFNKPRICGSKASATRPRGARSYFGGRSEFNVARTVFRATPSRRGDAAWGHDDVPGLRPFVVLPRRWKVERTLGWIMKSRRNVRDYERLPQHSEADLAWALITLMTRRLTRKGPQPKWSRKSPA